MFWLVYTIFITRVDTATPLKHRPSWLTYAEWPFYGLHRLRSVTEIEVTATCIVMRVEHLKIKLSINFHKQVKLIFLQQEKSTNLFLAVSKDFCFRLFNPNWPRCFCKFSKKMKKNWKNWNLHNYAYQRNDLKRVWKVLCWAFVFLSWAPVAAHPLLQIHCFLFRYLRFASVPNFVRPAPRRLVVTTGYYWGLLHKD